MKPLRWKREYAGRNHDSSLGLPSLWLHREHRSKCQLRSVQEGPIVPLMSPSEES